MSNPLDVCPYCGHDEVSTEDEHREPFTSTLHFELSCLECGRWWEVKIDLVIKYEDAQFVRWTRIPPVTVNDAEDM